MAGGVLRITKGKMFQAADEVLANPPQGKTLAQWYQELRQELVTVDETIVDLATDVGVIGTPEDAGHVGKEALGGPGDGDAFFPSIPNKELILREGFIKAYDLALAVQPTRTIVTYWMVVTDLDVFEVLLAPSPTQVNLFWVTSEPPHWGACDGAVEEDLWLVADPGRVSLLCDRIQRRHLLTMHAAGAQDAPPRSVANVQVLRLRSD